MSENESADAFERRVLERERQRERLSRIEARAEENTRRVSDVEKEVDGKIERFGHRLLEDISERWDDKLALFRADLKEWIKDEMVPRVDVVEEVGKAVEKIEAAKQAETRGTARFWFYVVMNTLGIASAVGTGIFWIVTTLSN